MQFLWILVIAGLSVSVLSAMESRVQWIASFCAFFGEGCRRTEDFTLFRIPISWWGLAYYALLALAIYFVPQLTFWVVMAGLGFELTFLRVMASIRAFCIFCLLNALVVGGLAWLCFDPARIWQAGAVVLFLFTGSDFLVSSENVSRMSAQPGQNAGEAVARIDGETITAEELERPLRQRIYKLEKKIYKLKRGRLETMIQERLLEKEAARRGISRQELIEEVLGNERHVSDERQEEIVGNFAEGLKEKYGVKIELEKPALPLAQVDVEDRPALGPEDAPVVVVEFSDPLCPACRSASETTSKIRDAYGDRIRWVFKDFPLESHQGAEKAAEAAHCAGEQGKFWEYHELVVGAEEDDPDGQKLKEYAASLGLEAEPFARCLEEGMYRDQVENDVQSGKEAGISAIPAFIVNGRMLTGNISFDDFKQVIEEELQADAASKGI